MRIWTVRGSNETNNVIAMQPRTDIGNRRQKPCLLSFPVSIAQDYEFPRDRQGAVYVTEHCECMLKCAPSRLETRASDGLDKNCVPRIADGGRGPIRASASPMQLRAFLDMLEFGLEKGHQAFGKLRVPRGRH